MHQTDSILEKESYELTHKVAEQIMIKDNENNQVFSRDKGITYDIQEKLSQTF